MAAKTFVSGAVLYAADLNSALDSAGWVAYTPTFANFTLGNGTLVAAYTQVGKAVIARIRVTLGSTSTMGTAMTVSLPVTANANNALYMPVGNVTMNNATSPYWGFAIYATSTTATLRYNANSSSTLSNPSATLPFTWATGHSFMVTLTYEAA